MITLLWPDGSLTTRSTWDEVEDEIASDAWNEASTREAFREDMRKRAGIWTGTRPISGPMSSQEFLTSLAEAGLFQILSP
jgi:hypothetical protein